MRQKILSAEIIEGFVGSLLIKKFDSPTAIPDVHREWWELCTSTSRFVALAAPRGFAKSTAITHSYTLASVLFRERDFVLVISGTEAQSIMFLNDIKSELMDNADLKQLFKVKGFLKDSESDIIVEMEDGHKFRIIAKGAEQKLRGVKWNGRRPNLIVCDDMEDDEQVLNKDRREKFRKWFYGALIPCIGSDGIIRVVGTILHMDSMLQRLMPEFQLMSSQKHKFIVEEELKTYTNHVLPWKSVKYKAHNDDFSQLLWPERWTKEALTAMRERFISQGLADVYSQEMLNVPLDEANAFFKKSDFSGMYPEDLDRRMNYYIAADLAISEKQKADYSAFVVGGLDDNGILHIVKVVKGRMDGRELVELILALETKYHPESFGIEEGTISKSIGPYLREEMVKRGIFPSLYLLKPSADKLTRARSTQARMRASAVRFDKSSDWYQGLEDEMTRFPRDRHDDQVDAMAYLGLMLDKMVDAPTPNEIADEVYESEYATSGLYEQGRNGTTGY